MGLVIIGIVVFLGLIAILIYNRLVGLRQNVRQGWADIDAQTHLERRENIFSLEQVLSHFIGGPAMNDLAIDVRQDRIDEVMPNGIAVLPWLIER